MTLWDAAEDEKRAAWPCTRHYALRTTSLTGSHPVRRSRPL